MFIPSATPRLQALSKFLSSFLPYVWQAREHRMARGVAECSNVSIAIHTKGESIRPRCSIPRFNYSRYRSSRSREHNTPLPSFRDRWFGKPSISFLAFTGTSAAFSTQPSALGHSTAFSLPSITSAASRSGRHAVGAHPSHEAVEWSPSAAFEHARCIRCCRLIDCQSRQ